MWLSKRIVPKVIELTKPKENLKLKNITDCLVPGKDPTYVPFGFYNKMKKVVESNIFYPIYIVGLSGNGKTLMALQVCAQLNREIVRVNITKDTDETDLIGSYELIDGNTVRREGPVLTAMRRGAILLLDETDYGSERLLCLQPILEGMPYLDKKTGEVIEPKLGFNIIATANTKGKGSDSGNFIGVNTLNEAFLERFAITVEQEYPSTDVERLILEKNFKLLKIKGNADFIENLVKWADSVRSTYFAGAVGEIISTRRLVHIAKAFHIFADREEAISLCLNRFDEDTKASFIDLYHKIADVPDVIVPPQAKKAPQSEPTLMDPIQIPGSQFAGVQIPPLAAVQSPSPSFAAAAKANMPVSPQNLPAFASAKVLYDMAQKYNERVVVSFDGVDYIIASHGKETRVNLYAIESPKEKHPGEFLDVLIGANKEKQMSKIADDYRPIQ